MMMEVLLIIVLGVVIIGFVLVYRLFGKNQTPIKDTSQDQAMLMLQNQLNELNKTLDSKLHQSSQVMQQQFSQSATIIRDVTERLTKLDETNKQVVGFADQLKSLSDILKNPKQRGILGEYYLETLLKNVMPPGSFEMQYDLGQDEKGNKLIVDAIVRVKDKIIPIDSKFSLENYNRLVEERNDAEKDRLEKLFVNDLKLRIQETAKYIQPNKGTMDFAFMFIPHEAIYYDLLINKIGAVTEDTENLIQRAANKYKVIIVSPTSFLAYLQTVMQGLRALKIEETAMEIRKGVEALGKHLGSYETYLQKLGNNLGTTVNMYNSAYAEFAKIEKDVIKIAGGDKTVEALVIDKPKIE
ncbi:MAG: DNA recombination protein RmuC [Candidatus Komeilibacteria bacterium]|nr:DNA recombination protein RmuC [Candidatus Komeilibacteria bacterium]